MCGWEDGCLSPRERGSETRMRGLQLGPLGDHRSGGSEHHVLFSQDTEEDNDDIQESTGLKPQSAAACYV